MVSILDLKIGNITSLENSLKYLGVKYKIIKTSKEIYKSRILIIPGVGSFDHAMGTIIEKNLSKSIKTSVSATGDGQNHRLHPMIPSTQCSYF